MDNKYYLIAYKRDVQGKLYHPCGSDGTTIGRYVRPAYIRKQAQAFAHAARAAEVYMLPACLYTQRACEMDASAFRGYVLSHGACLIREVTSV